MLYLAADGYCNDLIEMKDYIRNNVNAKTEIHILDYLNRYADVLLEELVTTRRKSMLIENKFAYSYCKKEISKILLSEHKETEWAMLLGIDDVNVMTETIAKDSLTRDKPAIWLGEGCSTISYLADKLDDFEMRRTSIVMAYVILCTPFNNALTRKDGLVRYTKFKANSLSFCAKKMVTKELCKDGYSKRKIIAGLPKILRSPDSIAFFEQKIKELEFYKVCETKDLLEEMEQKQSCSNNISITQYIPKNYPNTG